MSTKCFSLPTKSVRNPWLLFILVCLQIYTDSSAGPIHIVTTLYSPTTVPDCLPCDVFCASSILENSAQLKVPCLHCQCEPNVNDLQKKVPKARKHRKQMMPVILRLHCYFMVCPPGCQEIGENKKRYGCKYCACGPIRKLQNQ